LQGKNKKFDDLCSAVFINMQIGLNKKIKENMMNYFASTTIKP